MISQERIRIDSALKRFLDGQISLHTFQDLFVPESIDIEHSGDESAIDLAYVIDGILAEGAGRWTEGDLRDELTKATRPLQPSPSNKADLVDRLT
jgi:hypothetical protein